jgi:adenylate cyclase
LKEPKVRPQAISPQQVLHGRILIVDDKAANVMLLQKILQVAGYVNVTATTTPADVCAMHLKEPFDLILLDLKMPVMDGFAVMAALKEIETGGYLPVLVLTAQAEEKVRALKAGAKDFLGKPLDLNEVLVRVHNLLEVRLLHRETNRLYDELLKEQNLSERLLLNVLPSSIAQRLKGRTDVGDPAFEELIADRYSEVTVLFADIVGFTQLSEVASPEVLVDLLNQLFTRFDVIADDRGLEKIKTIGDCYMAAAGLPIPVADHLTRAAHMAADMVASVETFNKTSPHPVKIRIGIDTGAVVAGVIGKRKFLYDLWGDVVNTASRMENHSLPGRIHVTDATRRPLGEPFIFERRPPIAVKGKGTMQTWFMERAPA